MIAGYGLIGAAYLLGSLSSAIIVCRVSGFADPRTVGSGNPGATNVLREFGKIPAALTLAGDLLKGLIPVLAARYIGLPPVTVGGVALAAFLGHLYPVFFSLRGGKGVATYIGALFGLDWWLGAAFVGAWLVVAGLFRYSSLAALCASAVLPAIAVQAGHPAPVTLVCAVMAALIFWRHRSNIRNLWRGREDKIGSAKHPD